MQNTHIGHTSCLIICDLTQLLAVGESLLCEYPMIVDYILEIDNIHKNGFIHFLWSYLIKIDVGLTKGKGYLLW